MHFLHFLLPFLFLHHLGGIVKVEPAVCMDPCGVVISIISAYHEQGESLVWVIEGDNGFSDQYQGPMPLERAIIMFNEPLPGNYIVMAASMDKNGKKLWIAQREFRIEE